jgi:hypothetical protein
MRWFMNTIKTNFPENRLLGCTKNWISCWCKPSNEIEFVPLPFTPRTDVGGLLFSWVQSVI